MAETPKDENVTRDDASVMADAQKRGAAAADPLDGGAASEAGDAITDASEDPAVDTERLSVETAPDHIEGGEGHDSLAGSGSEGPWSAPAGDPEKAKANSGQGDSAPASEPTAEPVAARPAAKSGGSGRRLVVFLILAVLVVGVAYATYPRWREEALPYAEMAGIALPPLPGDADGDTADATQGSVATPAAEADNVVASADASGSSEPDSAAPAATPAPAPAPAQAAEPAATADDLAALADRVAAVEQDLTRFADQAPAAPASLTGDLTTLTDRVAAMETRLSALSDEMAIVRQGLGTADDTDGIAEVASGLSARLSELDARLSALENAPAAPTVSPEELAALASRIDALAQTAESRSGDLANKLDGLAAAQKDLADRQARGRNAQERAGALLMATNLLAAASTTSGDFSAELNAVETAASDDTAVADAVGTLKAHAGGVPSAADLRSRFPAMAASAIDASIVGADEGVVGTALTRIAALVTLRRTETAEGDAIDAILNRAEAAVNAGDLPSAVETLSALDGDPAKVAGPWLDQARARVAVDGAVRALQSAALAAVSGS